MEVDQIQMPDRHDDSQYDSMAKYCFAKDNKNATQCYNSIFLQDFRQFRCCFVAFASLSVSHCKIQREIGMKTAVISV